MKTGDQDQPQHAERVGNGQNAICALHRFGLSHAMNLAEHPPGRLSADMESSDNGLS